MKWGMNAHVWQRWFAWKPVRLVTGEMVWMEWVEVTGYVENPDIEIGTPSNMRILGATFCARVPDSRS